MPMGPPKGPAIDWATIGQQNFDRLVEMLLQRVTPTEHKVNAVEGRGGDRGRDVEVIAPDGHTTIYQFKYHPEGIAGPYKDRRRQVQRSAGTVQKEVAAGRQRCDQWVLVIPCKFTDSDRSFLVDLARKYELDVDLWDRPKLDALLVDHPGVADFMSRGDYAMAALRQSGMENAVLADGVPDLIRRVEGLAAAARAVDPDWSVGFRNDGTGTIVTPVPHHPRAAEVAPLTVALRVRFGPDDEALQNEFLQKVGYGSPSPVTIPPRNLSSFSITGSPLWTHDFLEGDGTLTLERGPSDLDNQPVTLSLNDSEGVLVGSHYGAVVHTGSGFEGFTVTLRFHKAVTVDFRIHAGTRAGAGNVVYAADVEMLPREQVEAAQLMMDLFTASTAKLDVGGRSAAIDGLSLSDITPADVDRYAMIRAFADDLDAIQRHTHRQFPVPKSIDKPARVYVRVARLLLEGQMTASPYSTTVDVTMESAGALAAPVILDALAGGSAACAVTTTYVLDLDGTTVDVGTVVLWHPAAAIQDPDRVRAELEDRREIEVTFRPSDATPWRIYVPDGHSHKASDVTPWNIPGIPEPGSFPSSPARPVSAGAD